MLGAQIQDAPGMLDRSAAQPPLFTVQFGGGETLGHVTCALPKNAAGVGPSGFPSYASQSVPETNVIELAEVSFVSG